MRNTLMLCIVLTAFAAGACGGAQMPETPSVPSADDMKAMVKLDIIDTAVADGNFKTLASALGTAGLIETLKGDGPFTVFAPNDDAFKKLPPDTLKALTTNPAKLADLQAILKFHVIPGRKVMAADITSGMTAKTVEERKLAFTIDGEKVMVNKAQVIKADIECTNGVIHVIDSVLLPPVPTPDAKTLQ
ncbi:MAG: fasciclin domain-containing protein [Myxococcota bacterium]